MNKANDIEQLAASWLVELDAKPSPERWAAFNEWLAADVRHRAAYLRLEASWRKADLLRRLRPLDGEVNEDLLRPAPAAHASHDSHAPHAGNRRRMRAARGRAARRAIWRAASGLAVAALGVASWMILAPRAGHLYETEIGEQKIIELTDGSTVQLNTDSKLHVRLEQGHRELVLERGEALFDVAHDERRPFDVEAGTTTLRALGTKFTVRLHSPTFVDVLVAEGRVAIDPPALQTRNLPAYVPQLIAGDTATVDQGKVRVIRLRPPALMRKLAWTNGELAFLGEPLEEAVREFNRYNHRKLVIADPAIARMQIGGRFDPTDPASFARALEGPIGVRGVVTGGATRSSQDEAGADAGEIRLVKAKRARR